MLDDTHSRSTFRSLKHRALVLAGMSLAVAVGHAAAPTIISAAITSGGGTSASPGDCYELDATLSQPTAGTSSGGSFILDSGFLPGRSDQEPIFHSGFEVCSKRRSLSLFASGTRCGAGVDKRSPARRPMHASTSCQFYLSGSCGRTVSRPTARSILPSPVQCELVAARSTGYR